MLLNIYVLRADYGPIEDRIFQMAARKTPAVAILKRRIQSQKVMQSQKKIKVYPLFCLEVHIKGEFGLSQKNEKKSGKFLKA